MAPSILQRIPKLARLSTCIYTGVQPKLDHAAIFPGLEQNPVTSMRGDEPGLARQTDLATDFLCDFAAFDGFVRFVRVESRS